MNLTAVVASVDGWMFKHPVKAFVVFAMVGAVGCVLLV